MHGHRCVAGIGAKKLLKCLKPRGAIVVLSCPEYRVYKRDVGWITAETAKIGENEHRIRNIKTFASDKTLLQITRVV